VTFKMLFRPFGPINDGIKFYIAASKILIKP
jgi:hypothetical protein